MNMGYELYLRSLRTDSLCYAAEHMPPVPSVLRGKCNKRELQPLAGVLLALLPCVHILRNLETMHD